MAKIKVICQFCGKEFDTWSAWIKKGAGKNCSLKCYFKSKKGKPSYIRTPEHKLKMSFVLKQSPKHLQCSRKTMLLVNSLKKGKTWEQIYGKEKAQKLHLLYREMNSGENNGNYIDGRSFLPYLPSFTKLLKERIIERDGFVCKGCGATHDELCGKDTFKRGLTIHHINYDKTNNVESNLISLCRACNSKANSKRNYYQEYYGNQI